MRLARYRPRRRHHWLAIAAVLAGVFVALGLVGGHGGVAMCAFHGWRLVHDLRRHHPLWGSMQLWEAAHRCHRVR